MIKTEPNSRDLKQSKMFYLFSLVGFKRFKISKEMINFLFFVTFHQHDDAAFTKNVFQTRRCCSHLLYARNQQRKIYTYFPGNHVYSGIMPYNNEEIQNSDDE